MDDIFLIHVHIGGLRIPLRIPRKDEELYRNAEKLSVRYLEEYQKKYSNLSYQEVLILVAFHMAVAISRTSANEDIEPLAQKIRELDIELKQVLNEK
jgi:cell division protein ZapA